MSKQAIIVGSHINALTIVNSLKALGFDGRIVLAVDEVSGRGMAGFCHKDIECWAPKVASPREFFMAVEERFGESNTYLLFTDERYLEYLPDWIARRSGWLHCHAGAYEQIKTILNRFEFCSFLLDNGIDNLPRTIDGTKDPIGEFGYPFVVRPKYSWRGFARSRVHIVEDEEDFNKAIGALRNAGLGYEDVCYQELLSIKDEDNVSICGWYDRSNQYIYCTHKVLQHPAKSGNGDVVELITAPEGVMECARNVLAKLDYEGPFELEFVYDEKNSVYKIIELNPRFWMQHGLIEAVTGGALAALSVGLRPKETMVERNARYWVNPMYAIFRALKLDFRGLRYIRRGAIMPCSLFKALLYAPIHVGKKL